MRVRIGIRAGFGLALLAAAGVAVALGAYPLADVAVLASRVWPVLLFAVAMTVVAELSSAAGVFDAAAGVVRRVAGRRPVVLWLLVAALSVACTVFLSLDTTVVLLTPVAIALARRAELDPRPFALVIVLLANTSSLLLPISNLTNLLAEQRMGLGGPVAFAGVMGPAWIACTAVPLVVVAARFRRALAGRERPVDGSGDPAQPATAAVDDARTSMPPGRGRLVAVVAIVLALLLAALLSGVPVWMPACAAAALLVALLAIARPGAVGPRLVPWRMLLLTVGLFAATGAASAIVLDDLVAGLPALDDSFGGLLAAAGLGAGAANLVNNLPGYLALEPVATCPALLAALLVGVNAGPLVTPWGSLATLLWHERLAADGVAISWGRFALTGLVVVPLCLVLGVAGLVAGGA